MGRNAILEVEDGNLLNTLNMLWRKLFEKKVIDALLIPQELPSGINVVQTLVGSPESLESPNPLAPVLPVNSARIVSQMTKVAPSPRRVGVVLRPCELRALIELVKLKQASLENLVLIGIDCFGTYSIKEYSKLAQEGSPPTEDFLKGVKEGREDSSLREACQTCEYPTPMNADLIIGLMGMDFEKSILLQASTPEGERILEALELKDSNETEVAKREEAISQLIAQRTKKRDELLEQTEREVFGLENLLKLFAPCINCRNCKTVCPLCYCKECFFDSPTFEMEAEKYLGWAEKRGTIKMPTDTLLFHLTRMNHMAISCVGCGMCQEACPNDIPVSNIFRLVGLRVQRIFDYVPGRSLEEELPLATFKEDELQEVG
ncbi:MAG: formate dehydrogenase [Dehalococcoidia bacterium]|nr:MAG: formate dehydrogenase [Dehalococcoidia bacterium]